MAIDVELKTLKQNNTSWPLTFKASNRFPIVANRVFATLEKAQQYVDDTAADASAYQGIILAVVQDSTPKNNGVYYVSAVAMAEGEKGSLVKVGGTETETAADYAAAVELSKTLVVGQLIKVENEYVENEGEENEVTYQKGFYIVEGSGVISALATSTGADDEVGALKSRVDAVEVAVSDLQDAVDAIEIPVKDIMVGDESLVDENGIARIVFPTVDLTPYEKVEDANAVRGRMDAAEAAISGNTAAISANTSAISANTAAISELDEAIKAIEIPVKDVTVDGTSVLGEDGVAAIVLPDLTPYEKVEDANAVRGRMDAAEAAISGNTAAIATKVEKAEGFRLMSDAEGTKLDGIEAGAEVNVIEVVKVNGQALTVAEADRSVEITIPTAPVQGVADDEKVLSLEGDKLRSTLTLAYVPATDEANAVLRLQGKDGVVVSSIDATAFVKDGMLSGAKLEGPKDGETGEKYLVLSFNTEAGKEDIRMDVTDLLDYYAAGDGLVLDGKTFAIQLDSTGESYLKVTTNGLSVSEALWSKVDEKDNAVLTTAKNYADGLAVNYDAAGAAASAETAAKAYADSLAGNYDVAGAAASAETAAKAYADGLAKNYDAAGAAADAEAAAKAYADGLAVNYDAAGAAASAETAAKAYADGLAGNYDAAGAAADAETNAKAYADGLAVNYDAAGAAADAEAAAKDYADKTFVKLDGFNEFAESMEAKLEGIEENADVNVIEAVKVNGIDAVVNEDKVAEVKVEAKDIELGEAIVSEEEEVYGKTSKLSAVLQGIQDSISVAISGGLTGVVGGDGIAVSAVAGNKQTISAKVSEAEGNLLSVSADGLYAAMYFEGDDVEE